MAGAAVTVIAWDGHTLAADSQATVDNETIAQVRKIHVLGDGSALSFSGLMEEGLVLKQWYENGACPDRYPSFQTQDNRGPTTLVVASRDALIMFREQPVAIPIEMPYWAWGTGAQFALGALARGADACEAVRVACQFSPWCELPVTFHRVRP